MGKKAKAEAGAPAGDAARSSEPGSTVNDNLHTRMAEHLALVMDMNVFKRIDRTQALDIGSGGYQKPYNAAEYKMSMHQGIGMYKCGFNMFMLNFSWSATPGVPIAEARVDMLMDYYFKKPGPVPFDLVIRVPSADFDPMKHVGGLQCVTPEEVKMAFLKAVVRDKDEDEDVLKEWRRIALTCTAVFKMLETDDDVFFEAFNARERLVNDFQSLARTAFQRIHEVAHFRQRKQVTWGAGMTMKKLCDEFNTRAELAATSEPVNLDFMQKALNIYDKAFSLPKVVEAIECLEAICKKSSPYDSVHKLAGIVRKAKDTPVIEWVFATITDSVVSKKSTAGDFPVRWLLGDAGGRGGAVDVYVLKHRMLEYLLTKQLDTLNLPSHVKEQMRHVLANHGNYRKFLNPVVVGPHDMASDSAASAAVDDVAKVDLSWRADWSRTAIMYLNFVERCCYSEDFDGSLRTASKMGKAPADVMQYESIATVITAITDMQQKEEAEQRKLQAGTAAVEEASGKDSAAAGGTTGSQAAAVAGGGSESTAETAAEQRLQVEAERIVSSKVTLLIEPDSQAELKSAIMSSIAGKVEGRDGSDYVVTIYDYKQAAESKTSPATRRAPLREARSTKCILATVDARRTTMGQTSMGILPGDMYIIFDGTRSGNVSKLKSGFVNDGGETLPKSERRLVLVYAEDGAARRRQLVRGTGSVKQQEGVMLVTRFKPKMNRRKRLHFEGTSAGDAIVNIPAPEEEWQLPNATKRLLYAHYRVDVGGKDGTDDEDDDDEAEMTEPSAKKKRLTSKKDDDEMETVFYFQPATSLVEELMHLAQARAVIDLTSGAGVWALAALENNIPYFGVVLTDTHLKELTDRLVREVKAKLTTPTSKLYMAYLAAQVKPAAAAPKPKPKAGNKDKKEKDKEKEKDSDKEKKEKKETKKSKKKKDSSSSDSDSKSPAK
jgi:hypothetical protein